MTKSSRYVEVEGQRIHVMEEGEGTPVLWVHGFPMSGRLWHEQARFLAGSVRSIVVDLPGFGGSRPIMRDFPDTTTMDDFADVLAGTLDELEIDEPIVLAGLSMGGYIAWAFVREYADRLKGLVLCSTLAGPDSEEAAAKRAVNAERVLNEGVLPLAEEMIPRLLGATTLAKAPYLADEIRDMARPAAPEAVAAALLGMAERPDSADTARRIAVPTLVIAGAEDLISSPAQMKSFASLIPNSQFVEIAEAGHLSPLERPKAVNAAVADYLAKLG